MKLKPTASGAVCIAISVAFLAASFFMQNVQILGSSIPLAGLSLLFLIPAIISFEYAQRLDMRKREKEIGDLTSALSSDLKREDRLDTKVRKDMEKLVGGLKEQDKELEAGLKKQEKTHTSDMKRQRKVNVDIKKRVKRLSSDVKKASSAGRRTKEGRRQETPSSQNPPSLQRKHRKVKEKAH